MLSGTLSITLSSLPRLSPSPSAALLPYSVHSAVYNDYVPHYPLATTSSNGPIFQSWTVGRVRFIMTDLRSRAGFEKMSTLSSEQRDWLFIELSKFANYGMVGDASVLVCFALQMCVGLSLCVSLVF